MNSNAKLARGVAVLVSAVWAVVLFLTGLDLDYNIRRLLAYLPSVIGLLVVAFDLWLWKIPGVSKVTGRPRLYGTWQMTVTPNTKSRIGKKWQGPRVGALVIEQTFWTIAVRFHTDQSKSSSTTAALVAAPDSKQSKNLYFTYANQARQEHNQRSYPHHGTTVLHVTGIEPKTLDGSYWTDRLTAGDIVAKFVNRNVNATAADALAAVETLGTT